MFRMDIEILILSLIIEIINFLKQWLCLRIFKSTLRLFLCWSWILIALAHNFIALSHLNSTEKMHRLPFPSLLDALSYYINFNYILYSQNHSKDMNKSLKSKYLTRTYKRSKVILYELLTYYIWYKGILHSFLCLKFIKYVLFFYEFGLNIFYWEFFPHLFIFYL